MTSDTPAALAALVSEQGTGLEELVEALQAALEVSMLGGAKKAAPSSSPTPPASSAS